MPSYVINSAGDHCVARHFQATQELFEVANQNRYIAELVMLGMFKQFGGDSEAIISA
jgi:hypothetical protein